MLGRLRWIERLLHRLERLPCSTRLWADRRDVGFDIFERLHILAHCESSPALSAKAGHAGEVLRQRPNECRARRGFESRDCPRSAHRGPMRCRRLGLFPACEPKSKAPSVLSRRDTPGRCGPSRCAWCGHRFHPSFQILRSPFIIGWSALANSVRKVAGAVLEELGADEVNTLSELRKQNEAQWSGMKPLPPSTYSKRAFS